MRYFSRPTAAQIHAYGQICRRELARIPSDLRLIQAWFQSGSPWRRRSGHLLGLYLASVSFFLLADALWPLPPPKPLSPLVLAQDNSLLCAYLTPDDKWRLPTSLASIHPDVPRAILAKEDRWFYWHGGINPLSVLRALGLNIWRGRRTSGASTVTMQLARLNEPGPRTAPRKLREMFRAMQYEWHYGKQQILEMYLAALPYGGNVEGVHSASYVFFDRPPDRLSLSQCILLAVIPNRPNSLRLDHHNTEAQTARDHWIAAFQRQGVFSSEALVRAASEAVPSLRVAFVPQSPHFCQWLLSRHSAESPPLHSTLVPAMQREAQHLLANHVRRVTPYGITNGAAIVLDNATGAILAYCGSANFEDTTISGQVNGIEAVRSPGSALKPVAYALAFEAGILTPQMRLLDVPTNFNGFAPDNFDNTFQGQVTAHHALTHSLNIPVVRLVQEMGLPSFIDALERAGFATVSARQKALGLSAVLGGCGVTLREMAQLYTAFARGGKMVVPEGLRALPPVERALFSPAAAWLTADVLSDIQRPDLPASYLAQSRLPRVAWKTGTSRGRRDAWSVGCSPRYTIGVWMGNFDGRSAAEMSGALTATPLLIDLFNALDYNPLDKWLAPPADIGTRQVCAETGLLPTPECARTTTDYFIRNVSHRQPCDLYQDFRVPPSGEFHYCTSCLPAAGSYGIRRYPVFPPELVNWAAHEGSPLPRVPPHNPSCVARFSGRGPQILSPSAGFNYVIEQGRPAPEIALEAASPPQVRVHDWYANGQFLGRVSAREKLFYRITPGALTITCTDDLGRSSSVQVLVKTF